MKKSINMDGLKEIPWSGRKNVTSILSDEIKERETYRDFAAIVLSAGKGTRMNSETQKVLHLLDGKPLVSYVLDTLSQIGIEKVLLVVGHQKEQVMKRLGSGYEYVVQDEQRGNADAVLQAKNFLENTSKSIFVFQGDDSFLFTPDLIKRMQRIHAEKSATITFLTCKDHQDFPETFWFIERKDNEIFSVHEGRGKNEVPEMLISTYLFEAKWLWSHLEKLRPTSVSKERVLPELVRLAMSESKKVVGIKVEYEKDWFGINTQEELLKAEKIVESRK